MNKILSSGREGGSAALFHAHGTLSRSCGCGVSCAAGWQRRAPVDTEKLKTCCDLVIHA